MTKLYFLPSPNPHNWNEKLLASANTVGFTRTNKDWGCGLFVLLSGVPCRTVWSARRRISNRRQKDLICRTRESTAPYVIKLTNPTPKCLLLTLMKHLKLNCKLIRNYTHLKDLLLPNTLSEQCAQVHYIVTELFCVWLSDTSLIIVSGVGNISLTLREKNWNQGVFACFKKFINLLEITFIIF